MEYIILLVTLAGIVSGADFLVTGSVSLARRFKISDFVIGAAIVGIGTSMPDTWGSFLPLGFDKGKTASEAGVGNIIRRSYSVCIPDDFGCFKRHDGVLSVSSFDSCRIRSCGCLYSAYGLRPGYCQFPVLFSDAMSVRLHKDRNRRTDR